MGIVSCTRICEDTGLGFERTNKLVFVQVFQQGRDKSKKQEFYAELARALEKDCGLPGSDLIVTCTENAQEDWSFGMGKAQFVEGTLPLKK